MPPTLDWLPPCANPRAFAVATDDLRPAGFRRGDTVIIAAGAACAAGGVAGAGAVDDRL